MNVKLFLKRKRDNYANKMKREKLTNYLRSELRSCTTHGLTYIVNPEIHCLERVYWIVNFVVCLGIAITLLTSQYVRFINSPVVMSVEMDYFNWNVSYPAITLCPNAKIDKELFNALINETRLRTGKNLYSYFWSIATASLDNIEQLAIQDSDTVKLLKTKEYAGIAALLFEHFENSTVLMRTNWPLTIQPAMTEMGMCHVINSNVAVFHNPFKWKDKTTPYVKNNIELSAHDIDLFIQIMNYHDEYKYLCQYLKTLLAVGNGFFSKFNYKDSSWLSRNQITAMGNLYNVLQETKMEPSPDEIALSTTPSYTFATEGYIYFGYRVWTAKISETLQNVPISIRKCRYLHEPLNKRYPIYSYNHCLLECRIQMILTLCGCLPHFYKPLDNERICDFSELLCVIRYKNEILRLSPKNETLSTYGRFSNIPKSSQDCDCPSDCESHVYLKDAESFLSQAYMNRLRIGISKFPKVRVKREFIFSTHDMILKTGGVINLCIGSSVISLLELIMTVVRNPIANLTGRVVKKIRKIKEKKTNIKAIKK